MAKMQLFAIFGVETGFYSSCEGLSRYNVFMQGVYEEWLVLCRSHYFSSVFLCQYLSLKRDTYCFCKS